MGRKMAYTGDEEREVPGFGVYRPGDVVDFDEILIATGLFSVNEPKHKRKEGED